MYTISWVVIITQEIDISLCFDTTLTTDSCYYIIERQHTTCMIYEVKILRGANNEPVKKSKRWSSIHRSFPRHIVNQSFYSICIINMYVFITDSICSLFI